ncbi:MAG: hypothetical protein KBA71_12440 [Opitutaceae bacterium]|nr:hypothetical protein [Opitutaceae bacterium]
MHTLSRTSTPLRLAADGSGFPIFPMHSGRLRCNLPVAWQVWTALLLYVLLRFQVFVHGWPHSFTRLFTLLRGVVWDHFDLSTLLTFYGTAGGRWRMRAQPEQGYLPGLAPLSMG